MYTVFIIYDYKLGFQGSYVCQIVPMFKMFLVKR